MSRLNYNFTFKKVTYQKAAVEGKGNRYSENGGKRWKETEYKELECKKAQWSKNLNTELLYCS